LNSSFVLNENMQMINEECVLLKLIFSFNC
jgi:hypothetical protein